MRAPRSVGFGALILLAAAALRCGGSSNGGSSSGGNGGNAGSAAQAGTGGRATSAGGASGASGAGASDNEAGAAGASDPNIDAGMTTPVIGDIADIAVVENTVVSPTKHVSFTVTDPGGLAGLTVTATSADPTHVTPAKGSCSNGTCTFDVTITPILAASVAVTVVVANPRGGSAMSQFAVVVAPLTVTTEADVGSGSLRATVDAAATGDVVVFDAAVKTVLLASPVGLNRPVTVSGPGAASLTIDGGNGNQVFAVSSDQVNLHGMTITHATFGVAVFNAHLLLDSVVVANNTAVGLSVSGTAGKAASVDASGSTFSGNATNGAVMQVTDAGSSASGNFTGCTFTGNGNGVAAVTNAAGQIAHIGLLGGNLVHDNTKYGVVVEVDGGLGSATLDVSATNNDLDNLINKNPVGVFRSGVVPSNALTIAPATQVTGNTTNFTPAWP
jgi:hypothetical protein